MKLNIIISIIILTIYSTTLVSSESKVLKNYVEKFDSNYKWTLKSQFGADYGIWYILELTSQKWMEGHTDYPIWKHWLTICKPNDYVQNDANAAILHITDGINQNWTIPTLSNIAQFAAQLCSTSKSITAALHQVPNQFITFNNDGIPRTEDEIVAYTWRRYMDDNSKPWISLLPQTKSCKAAMDAIQAFGVLGSGNYKVEKFLVSGASKRGWTTFGIGMSGDKRLIAIVPMVIPVLNLVKNIEAQMQAYGNWSFALQSYIDQNITTFFQTEYFKEVIDVVDPLNYLDTLSNVPKFIIITVADEFFLPDSPRNFYSQLKGEKRLGLYQTNHGITGMLSVADEISKYFKLVSNSKERPQLNWNIVYSSDRNTGTITMNVAKGTPTKVQIWSASTISTTRRDFRKFICTTSMELCFQNITWASTEIALSGSNSYSFTLSKPAVGGWSGFYFEVDFSDSSIVQSELAIVPDVYPYPTCSKQECGSGVPDLSSSSKVTLSLSTLVLFSIISLFLF